MKDYCVVYYSDGTLKRRDNNDAQLNGTIQKDYKRRHSGEDVTKEKALASDETAPTTNSRCNKSTMKTHSSVQEDQNDRGIINEDIIGDGDIHGLLDDDVEKEEQTSSKSADDIPFEQLEALLRDAFEKLAKTFLWVLTAIISLVRHVIVRFFWLSFYIFRSSFAVLVGMLIFLLCVHLQKCFVGHGDIPQMPTFVDKLFYVIRMNVWSLVPVAVVLPISHMHVSPVHRAFLRQSFDHMALALVNTTLMATYMDAISLGLLRNVLISSVAFRLLCWLATISGLPFIRRATMTIPTIVCFLLILFNIYYVIGQGIAPLGKTANEVSVQTDEDPEHDLGRSKISDNIPWIMWIAAPITALLGTNLGFAY